MRLYWDRGLASQPWVRFCVTGGTHDEHDHDFPEWFWVESGRMLHRCEDVEEELGVGDLILLHPRHRHSIVSLGGAASHVVCSVEPRLFARIAARLRPQLADWPWPGPGRAPTRRRLGARALAHMRALLELLPLRAQSPADAELLVAGTLRVLVDADSERPPGAAPDWLQTALAELQDPVIAARGVQAFITRCGRASATVCRACRRHTGRRPNDLVEAARLDHAARRLRSGSQRIEDVAEDCGYASLSHFYRAFKRRFDCAPGAFRISH